MYKTRPRRNQCKHRVLNLCRMAGVRARVLSGTQYIGHIYDDK